MSQPPEHPLRLVQLEDRILMSAVPYDGADPDALIGETADIDLDSVLAPDGSDGSQGGEDGSNALADSPWLADSDSTGETTPDPLQDDAAADPFDLSVQELDGLTELGADGAEDAGGADGAGETLPQTEPLSDFATSSKSGLDPQQAFAEWSGDASLREVVFIDTATHDYWALVDDILDQREAGRDIELVLLESDLDGIQQITSTLAGMQDVDAVHLVTHGSDGNIQLGSTSLSYESLQAHAGELAQWAGAFSEEGDLLLYGCDVAATAEGREFVAAIGELCDCDITASNDLTGHDELGGDWELEFLVGAVEVDLAFTTDLTSSWHGTLDTTSNLVLHHRFDTDASDSSANNYDVESVEQQLEKADSLLPMETSEVNAQLDALQSESEQAGQLADVSAEMKLDGLNTSATELVIVDSQVEDFEQLIADLHEQRDSGRNLSVLVLDSSRDGIAQVTEALSRFDSIDSLQIVSHGNDSGFQLGNAWITKERLSDYTGEFSAWQNTLSADADISIFGCNLAAGEEGQSLLNQLAVLTGADIAASDDLTGHAVLGGDWELEYFVGAYESQTAFTTQLQASWVSTLDVTTGLVAQYEFEENGGGTATDSTVNNNDGTWSNAPSWDGDAAVGSFSLDFTGDGTNANEVVNVPDDASLDFSGDFSVAFWYNSSVAQANSTRIIGSHDGSDGFSIYTNGNGDLSFFAQGSNASTTQTQTGGIINDGTWHHVVAVKSADSLRLYVDEHTSGVAATSFGAIDVAAPLTIGGESATVGDFEGKLDDVRVYTRALSASDVGELYDLGVARTSYSTSSGLDNSSEHISNVTFAGINNTTGADAGGYGDYTAQTASIVAGSTNTLSVTISPDSLDYVTAWVDWNQDFDFNDAGEEFVVATNVGTAGPHTVSIAAPNDAVVGSTRMRVSLVYNDTPNSFGSFANGEVEDYTINVVSSTITVSTTADENDGDTSSIGALLANSGGTGISLREAIIASNNTAGADTIVLGANVYDLTRTGSNESFAAIGDLDIRSDITIIGAGTGQTTISASGLGDRIFDIDPAGELTLNSLTIADANSSSTGGAIENSGVLTAYDVVIRDNTGGSSAGAIQNSGDVTLERVSLYDNSASSFGGAIRQTAGTLSLTNVVVSGNSTSSHAGAVYMTGGTANVNHSTFADNVTGFNTGGFLVSGGSATISNSIFADNTGGGGYTQDISGNITSGGRNILESYSGFTAAGTDITGSYNVAARTIDPATGQAYYAIAPGDAAINAAGGSSPATDILGTTRDANPDIGAYEFIPAPQTFTVTNTLDDGSVGSLRWAIAQANANAGADTIDFNIAGTGAHTINLLSALPNITEAVTIDATTDDSFGANSNRPAIILDGNNSFVGDGFVLDANADGTTIRGFVIRDFSGDGIEIQAGSEGNTIAGNYIGRLTATGTDAGSLEANTGYGINLRGSNNTIGGLTDADRNVIAGNAGQGQVRIDNSNNNTIVGNYIGTDATGTSTFVGQGTGIYIYQGAGHTIGGTTASTRNLISGANDRGLEINGATDVLIQGNYIGTDVTGTVDLGSTNQGIYLYGADNTLIGGTDAGAGNLIMGNDASGIAINNNGTGNSILGNSIFANGALGIDLNDDGVTPNDPPANMDSDTGDNNLQNFPVLWTADVTGSDIHLVGSLNSEAGKQYRVEFYSNPLGTEDATGYGEARVYLGSVVVTTDGSGNASIDTVLSGVSVGDADRISATATEITNAGQIGIDDQLAYGSTSEMSQNLPANVVSSSPGDLQAIATDGGGLSINEDGGNDVYLKADGGIGSTNLTELTYELQFNTSTTTARLAFLSYFNAGQDALMLTTVVGGDLRIAINNNVVTSDAMNYESLQDGNDHTLSFTWDNSGAWAVYVDGVIVDSDVLAGELLATGETITTGGTLVIGQEQDSEEGGFAVPQRLSATLYDARIFSSVRTANEIAASYRSDVPYDEAGMITNWKFDQLSSEGVVTDAVSGNNLTVKHVTEPGFTVSEASLTFSLDENAIDGTVVGQVYGVDAEREARIASLLATDADLRYNAETGKFYKGFSTTGLWSVARTAAESTSLNGVNGQLVTIRSASENEFVRQIADNDVNNDVWIGATDSTVEGEWRWVDGGSEADQFWQGDETGYNTSDAYDNFQAGQPNDAGSNEDVARLDDATGEWLDADHDNHNFYGYIVEWDADAVLDATDALTYSIASQSLAGAFEIDADTGEIRVADGTLLDADNLATHTITVRTADSEVTPNTVDEVFTISLNNLVEDNSAPTDLSSGIELNSDGGNDAYLQIGDATIFDGLDELAFEVTFSGLTNVGSQATIYSHSDPGVSSSVFAILADGTLDLDGISTAGQYTQLFDGDLHHLGFSWDASAGEVTFYVDGEFAEAVTAPTFPAFTSGGTLVLGQHIDHGDGSFDPAEVFSGTLHDLRVWNEVRSGAEIALNYQNKFDGSSLPGGLIANWQMDGFNGSNEVVDVVSGNNLSIGHATDPGFTSSTPVGDLHISENATDGASVGFVVPSDPDISNDVVNDGLFTEGTDPGTNIRYTTGQTFGDWRVDSGDVDHHGTLFADSPLGGHSVGMNGSSPGAISQDLATETGKQYQVVFALSGEWDGGEATKDLRVSAGGEASDFSITQPSGWTELNPLWDHRSFTFTADGTTSTLQFASRESGSDGPVIADVQVIEIPAAVTTILNNDPTLSYDAATGKFYKVTGATEQFTNAQTTAGNTLLNGVSGQLVTIDSAYENQVIRNIADVNLNWMGASDASVEGEWRWLDGTADEDQFSNVAAAINGFYSNWASGQPNGGTLENFAYIDIRDGEWGDSTHLSGLGVIIEWDASEVLSNFTFSLTDDAGGRFAIDSSTGEITVANGSLLDYETATSQNITVRVLDSGGESYDEVLTIAVNDIPGPSQTIPIGQTINEDESLVFSSGNGNAITVSDGTASNSRVQVTLEVTNGTLRLNNFGGYVWVQGTNGSSLMTLEGTESAINAALEDLTYTPNADYNGSDNLVVTTALNADLEGYHTFEGGNADDQSASSAQNGTLVGGANTTTDAQRGEVLNLDAAGEYVRIDNLYSNPTNVTLSAWVHFSSLPVNGGEIISLGNDVALRVNDGSQGVTGFFWDGSTHQFIGSGTNLSAGQWHHVAFSFDDANNTQNLYIDGQLVGSGSFTDSINWTGLFPQTTIGTHANLSDSNFDFQGMIDEARVYNRALSADEIAAIAADEFEATGIVPITINAINDAPYFSDKTNATVEQISLTDVMAVTSTDLDNDGDADLIATTDTGSLYWYENDGTGGFGSGNLIASAQNFRAVEVYDLEGDGDMDIVAINDDPADAANSVYVLTNNFIGSGTVSFNTTSFEGPDVGDSDGGQDLAIANIDGDVGGLADIVVTFYRSIGDSQVVVFEQNTVGVWTKTYSDAVNNANGVELSDLDGDGDLDIVVGDFQDKEIRWYENDGAATAGFTRQTILYDSDLLPVDVNVGDFDGDGDQDIVYATWGSTDEVVLLRNDGLASPSFTAESIYSATTGLLYHIDVADMDGDGHDDLIVTNKNTNSSVADVLVFDNDGSGNFTQRLIDDNAANVEWAEAADLDGDGNLDIIAAPTSTNAIEIYKGQSNGFVVAQVNEDVAFAGLHLEVADDAGANLIEVSINVVNGSIILPTGSVAVLSGGSSTSAITFEGTVADVNTALNSFTFSPDADFNGLGEIQVTVDDRGNTGTGGVKTVSETLYVEVMAVNDTPVATAPAGPLAATEQVWMNLEGTGFTVSDVDDLGGTMTASLTANEGAVSVVVGDSGVSIISGNGTGTVVLSGTETQLNALLTGAGTGTLQYRHPSNSPPASTTLTLTVNDQGNTGADPGLTGDGTSEEHSATVTVNITAVNDDPVAATIEATPVAYTENDGAVAITSTITFADVDDTNIESAVVQISGGYQSGEDVLSFTDQNGITGVYNAGTGTWTLTGTATLAQYETAIRSITYTNSSENPNTATRTVSFTVNDGDVDSNTLTRDITIGSVNDAPVVTGPGSAYSFTENGSLNIHGTGFSLADVDDNGGTMTATFTVGEGRVLIDAGDSGVTLFSGAFNTSGNSTDTVTFTGTKAQINALLSGSSTGTVVYYHDQTASSDVPSASTTITLTVNDQGNTGSDPGLTGDGSSEEHFASQTINITSVNDSPEFLGPNLITNGTFDTDLSGWTTTGTSTQGSGRVSFGSGGNAGPHTLSQTLATTIGDVYVLEFDYRDGHASLNQQLQVTVDGSSNLLTSEQILTDTDDSTFVRYRFEFTADSTSSTLTFTDTSDDVGSLSARTNGVDGAVDNIIVRQTGGQLGTAAFTEDGAAVVLGSDFTLFDAEIDAALDDFDGTTLTLARNGGANSDDVFSENGLLGALAEGGSLVYNSVTVGAVTTNSSGTLVLTFNATADQTTVDNVIQAIAYSNSSDTPPSSVQIDWTFNDNNSGSQGSGGSLEATGSTVVNITDVNDRPVTSVASASGPEDSTIAITLTGSDVDGTVTSFEISTLPANGTLYLDAGLTNAAIALNTYAATSEQLVVYFAPDNDWNGTTTFTFAATDNDGSWDTTPATATLVVSAVNDTPNVAAPVGALAASEQTNLNIHGAGFSVTDVDVASGVMTATFSVGEGSLSLAAGDSGVSILTNNTSTVSFTGTLTQLNALLTGSSTGTIVYFNSSDTPSPTTSITLTVNDGGNLGADPGLTADGSSEEGVAAQTINLTATNDDPTNLGTLPTDVAVAEDVLSNVDLSAVNFSDVDAGSSSLTVTLSTSTGGELTLAADGSLTFGGTAAARTITGTLANLNAYFDLAGNIQYQHGVANTVGDNADSITVVINDNGNTGNGGGADQTIGIVNVDIVAANDAPILEDGSASIAVNEHVRNALFLGKNVADPDVGDFDGGTLTFRYVAGGVVDTTDSIVLASFNSVSTSGSDVFVGAVNVGTFAGGANGSPLVISFNTNATVTEVAAVYGAASFGNITNDPIAGERFVEAVLTDGDGGTSNTANASIIVNPINDTPVNTVPGAQNVNEDGTLVFSVANGNALAVADADAGAGAVEVTLSVDAGGTLSLAQTTGLTFTTGDGVSDAAMVFSGTVANVNAALDGLSYVTASDFNGSATLSLTTNDGGNSGADPGLTGDGTSEVDVDTVAISVNAVNDAPVVSGPALALSANEQTALSIAGTGFGVTDVDAATGTMTATIAVGEGTVTVVEGDSGVTISSGNGSGLVTLSGTLGQIDNLLTGGGTGTITYFNNSDTPSPSTSITVTVNDGGNTGVDPGLTGDGSSEQGVAIQTINLNAVNDDPTNAGSLPTDVAVAEDVLSSIDLSAIDLSDLDAGSSNLTLTLSTSAGGELTLAADASLVFGGTPTARTITGSLADLNAYLDTASNIQYLHSVAHTFGDNADTLTVVINDNGNTGAGGGLDQTLGVVNIDITAVNDSPTLAVNTGASVSEGGAVTITNAMLNEGDVDDSGVGLTYTVTAGPTNGQLELSTNPGVAISSFSQDDIDNNRVRFVHDGTQASVDSFSFSLADGGEDGAASVLGIFNFTVGNVNDAPVASGIEGAPLVYTENDGAVAVTSSIAFTDVDDTDIESAVVQFVAGYNSGEDQLSFVNQNGISGGYDSVSGSWTLTGTATLAEYETAIRSITYTNTSDQPDTSLRTVSFTVNDGDANSNTLTRDIDITSMNDTPVVSGPALALSVNEQTALSIAGTGFGVTDVDAATGAMTATIAVGEGTVTVVEGDSGVTISSGNGSGLVTLSGTLGQIDNLLTGGGTGTITYFNNSDTPSPSTTITVTVNDGGNTGVDPGLTGDGSSEQGVAVQTINLNSVNDDPSNAGSLPTDVAVTEDVLSSIDLSAIDLSDLDAGSSNLTLTLSTSAGGELTLAADASLVFGGTSTARTITGSLADLNAYLDIASNIQYLHSVAHTFGDNADTLTVVINDNGNTGAGGGLDQTLGVVNIDITAVNDSPTLAVNTGASVSEGGAVTITNAMLNEGDVDDSGVGLTYTVTAGPTNGQLELSTNPGVAISSFSQDDIDNNRVRFVHDGTQASVDSFSFSLADGGEDGAASVLGVFNFTVNNVNDEQVLAVNVGATFAEGSTGNLIDNTMLLTTDVDHVAAALTYTVSAPTSNGTLRLGGVAVGLGDSFTQADIDAGLISYDHDGSETLSDSFMFSVDDGVGTPSNGVFGITIAAVNDSPVNVAPLVLTATEETPLSIGSISISDADAGAATVTTRLQVTSGTLNVTLVGATVTTGANGTNDLTLSGSVADINATLASLAYTGATDVTGVAADQLTIATDDLGNTGGPALQDVDTIQIDIIPVNDPPSLTLSGPATFVESGPAVKLAPSGSVGDVDSADLAGGALTVSLTSGAASQDRLGLQAVGDGVGEVNVSGASVYYEGVLIGTQAGGSSGFDPFVVSFNGNATPEAAEAVLQSVSYFNVSGNPGVSRTFELTLTDGDGGSSIAAETLGIVSQNNPPELSGSNRIVNSDFASGLSGWSASGQLAHSTQLEMAQFGSLGGANDGVLSQSFSTTAGAAYEVTFDYGDDSPTLEQSVNLTVSGASGVLNQTIDSASGAGVTRYAFTFVADAATTTLSFADVSSSSSLVDGLLDNVVVSQLAEVVHTEDAGATILDAAVLVEDLDSLTLESARITIASNYVVGEDVLLFTDQSGITGLFDAATGTLNLTGTASVADYQSALGSIAYDNLSDAPSELTRTLQWSAFDGLSDSRIRDSYVHVIAVNDDPYASGIPAQFDVVEDTATTLDFSSVDLIDLDSSGSAMSLRLSVSSGTLTGANAAGVTVVGSGTSSLVVDGDLVSLNDYLDGLNVQYTTALDASGSNVDTVQLELSDNGNTGVGGGALLNLGSAPIHSIAQNDAPFAISLSSAVQAVEDVPTPLDLSGTQLGDVDAGASALELRITAAKGVLLAASTPDVTVASSGANTLVLTGDVSSLNSFLASSIQYQSAPNDFGVATDTLTFVANDLGNTGAGGGGDVVLGNVQVDVSPVNDAPTTGDWQLATYVNTAIQLDSPGLLSLASDVDNANLSAVLVSGPSDGALVFQSDGSMLFIPVLGQSNTVTFQYAATDGLLVSAPATVEIEVLPVGNGDSNKNKDDDLSNTTIPIGVTDVIDSLNEDEFVTLLSVVVPQEEAPAVELGNTNGVGAERRRETAFQQKDVRSPAHQLKIDSVDTRYFSVVATKLSNSYEAETVVTRYESALSWEDTMWLSSQLDAMAADVRNQTSFLSVGEAEVVAGTLVAGYVFYVLRGGHVAAWALSSTPAWLRFDPLYVLGSSPFAASKTDDESLAEIAHHE